MTGVEMMMASLFKALKLDPQMIVGNVENIREMVQSFDARLQTIESNQFLIMQHFGIERKTNGLSDDGLGSFGELKVVEGGRCEGTAETKNV